MLSTRILRLKAYPLFAKSFSTDRSSWISVLDDPKIQSPFDNPRRTSAVTFFLNIFVFLLIFKIMF